jgi:hypothetical protein
MHLGKYASIGRGKAVGGHERTTTGCVIQRPK